MAIRAARALIALLVVTGSTALPSTVMAQGDEPRSPPAAGPQDPAAEARAAVLRAMIVLKIAPYLSREGTEQPGDKTPYRIAVVGDDGTIAAIKQHLPSKEVGKRAVEVVVLTAKEAAEPGKEWRFDAMFLAFDLDAKLQTAIVAAHQKLATVLICERPGFAKAGGGVQLFVENNSLRFEVNQEALKQQGVRASHQLLKLSKRGPEK